MTRVFLSAEWRYLAMLTYEAEPSLLRPLVPRGTELDTHDGRVLLSVVGFRFLHTRVLGVPVPFHRDFDEVNLRFYVRRETRGELRKGVTFIREIVPRRVVAFVARIAYNEPYVARRMQSDVPADPTIAPFRVRYAWRSAAGWDSLALTAQGSPGFAAPPTQPAFITEHHWGYSRQRDGSTLEYHVRHPRWRVWLGRDAAVQGDMGAMFGAAFGPTLGTAPASVLLAEGSQITVSQGSVLR